jgi:hypothetical protein
MVMPITSIKIAIPVLQEIGLWGSSSKERIKEISVSQLGQVLPSIPGYPQTGQSILVLVFIVSVP